MRSVDKEESLPISLNNETSILKINEKVKRTLIKETKNNNFLQFLLIQKIG